MLAESIYLLKASRCTSLRLTRRGAKVLDGLPVQSVGKRVRAYALFGVSVILYQWILDVLFVRCPMQTLGLPGDTLIGHPFR